MTATALDDAMRAHRRALHVHCYRMVGNFEDAEDLVQETLTRAWAARDAVDGAEPEAVRSWLYRIATNASLDLLRSAHRRKVRPESSYAELPWLQPYPDRLLDEATPETEAIARETIGLAFLRMVQLLPPRQRAALLLRDVVGLSAAETAAALDQSVPAVNSALQRARATLGSSDEPPARTVDLSPAERQAVERFIDAHQRGDYAASIALMHSDIRVTMPPEPMVFEGIGAVRGLLDAAYGGTGEPMGTWRLAPVGANRMPATASYLQAPGDDLFRAFKFDLFEVRDGLIVEATTFGANLFEAFGLPLTLEP